MDDNDTEYIYKYLSKIRGYGKVDGTMENRIVVHHGSMLSQFIKRECSKMEGKIG